MKILLTGGAGYLGSAFLPKILSHPAIESVTVLDNFKTGNKIAFKHLCSPKLKIIEGDLLSFSDIDYALRDITVVVHLAALSHTPLSSFNAEEVTRNNVWGTANLTKALKYHSIEKLVFASSISVYGARDQDGTRVEDLMAYPKSKLDAEKQFSEQFQERSIPVSTLRLGTLFGLAPVMNFDSFVNRMAFDASINKRVIILGSGNQERAITHVDYASRAFLHALLTEGESTSYDIFNEVISPKRIAEIITSEFPFVNAVYTDQDIRTRYSFFPEGKRLEIVEGQNINNLITDQVEAFRTWQ